MAEADRQLTVVKPPPRTPQQSREAFVLDVQAVMQTHDIASEACWQHMARLVAQHWQGLCQNQAPQDTWTMISKCTDSVLKIRRLAQRAKGQSGTDALAEFQDFMRDVLEIDEA